MDRWGEYLALGVDIIIFGVCSRLYLKHCYSVNLVQRAQIIGINPDASKLSDESRQYVIYQGQVWAAGRPIKGLSAPDITGVVQRLTIREHAIARNASGFWADHKSVIKEAYNVVPFFIKRGSTTVEILDPVSADILDLDTIHNKFENTNLSFMDQIVGFFNGIRQRGIETTEELLKEGSVITAIGEVSIESDGSLQLAPSSQGYPYYITSMPVSSLLRKLEEQRSTYKWLTYLFGGVGLALLGIVMKRLYNSHLDKLKNDELKKQLDESRKERRRNARTGDDLHEIEKCVVCRENPKEIIIQPCGHVCICEDCSDSISGDCPVCRTTITNKAAAFIS